MVALACCVRTGGSCPCFGVNNEALHAIPIPRQQGLSECQSRFACIASCSFKVVHAVENEYIPSRSAHIAVCDLTSWSAAEILRPFLHLKSQLFYIFNAVFLMQDRPNGVVNERRNSIAAHGGTIVQRSVPALNMDHSYYQGGTTGEAPEVLRQCSIHIYIFSRRRPYFSLHANLHCSAHMPILPCEMCI